MTDVFVVAPVVVMFRCESLRAQKTGTNDANAEIESTEELNQSYVQVLFHRASAQRHASALQRAERQGYHIPRIAQQGGHGAGLG